MKFLASIMAVLILALSIMPCSDTHAETSGNSKSEITSPIHQHNTHEDACSPFCICNCCAGASLYLSFVNDISITTLPESSFTGKVDSAVFDIPYPVWQPPQLI